MSTILDALRKVQRERDRDSPDLRHAIADERLEPAAPRGPALWIAGACLVVLVAGASTFLFLGGDLPGEAIAEDPEVAAAEAASALPEPSEPVAATPGPAAEAPERPTNQSIREAVRATLLGARGDKGKPPASARFRVKPDRAALSSGTPARRPRGPRPVRGALPAQPDPQDPAPVHEPPALAAADPEPVPTAVPPPEPVRVAAVPTPEPAPPPPPRAAPSPPRPRPSTSRPAPERAVAPAVGPRIEGPTTPEHSAWPLGFPDLQLESVRWHPDSSRREARLLVDATRSIEAREGDIVQGVAVHRIDPGAVELRVGDVTRRLRIGQ